MKSQKYLLLLSMAWTLAAQAHVKVPNLWNELEAQKNWREVTIEVPGLSGKITGILTDGKKVRLDNFGVPLRSQGQLDSNVWGIFSTRARFKQDCHLFAGIIDRVRAKQNRFTLTFPTIPLKPDFLTVVHSDGSREQLRGPSNTFQPIGWIKVEFEKADAPMVLRTGLDLEFLGSKLAGQLMAQKESVASEGQASLDLTGYDDVACDLLNNRLKIKVTANYMYSSARIWRTPLFKQSEVEALYADLAKRSGEAESDSDPRILMPAYLGISLTKINRDIDQLAAWEVQRLYQLFVDPTSGRIRQVSNNRLKEITGLMDRLDQRNTWSNPVYTVDLEEQQ